MKLGMWTAALLGGTGMLVLAIAPASFARDSGIGTATCGDLSITYAPTTLWPPNHKMRTIEIQATDNDSDTVTGSTGALAEPFSITVTNITSNQTEAPGEGCGHQDPDSSGVNNTASGTDPGTIGTTVQVRGERCGHEGDRVYDIQVSCTDEGTTSSTDLFVTVPHSHGHLH